MIWFQVSIFRSMHYCLFTIVSLPTGIPLETSVDEDLKIRDDLPEDDPLAAYAGQTVNGISVDGGNSFINLVEYGDLSQPNVKSALAKNDRIIRFLGVILETLQKP